MSHSSSQRRSFVISMVGTAIGLGGSIYFAYQWAHSTSPDASTHKTTYLVLCGLYVVAGFIRFLYRNKRNYFAELMAQRRAPNGKNRESFRGSD